MAADAAQKVAPEIAALLKPLKFAERNVSRLVGFEPLLEGAVKAARASTDAGFLEELLVAGRGFDHTDDDDKRVRVRKLLALLERGPVATKKATTASATASAAGGVGPGARGRPRQSDVMNLEAQFIKGIGPKRAEELKKRDIHTLGDLLYTLPRTYEDRRATKKIAELIPGQLAAVSGTVIASGAAGMAGRGGRYEIALDDGSGSLRLVFFHYRLPEMQKRFPRGAVVTVSGEVQAHGGRMQMVHPRTATGARVDELGGVQPVYPEIQGLHRLELARCCKAALDRARGDGVPDPLPPSLLSAGRVEPLLDAFVQLHDPKEDLDADAFRALVERRSNAHRRMAFEELMVLATALALRRKSGHVDAALPLVPRDPSAFAAELPRLVPFALTKAQERAIADIARDVERSVPMARLLQGDVGAGKTAVAAAACLRAVRAGAQAAFMAPTELLAEQHATNLKKMFTPLGVRVDVLTGSLGKKARAIALARLKNRDLDVAIGTQALLSEGVEFARLGLCVVDEQHRFGVVQRAQLRDKGVNGAVPHLLVMTATPIPRSLALTVYGDLDISVLDELPPGRTPVATQATRDVTRAHAAITEVLARDERAFVVYPLIDESEKIDLAAATAGYEELASMFGEARVGLLHGRMKAAERDQVMARFQRGDIQILVSTTVIEVGVDVAKATLMVIMNAERFGLAQLHQLRGRVGRSVHQSRCILVVAGGGEDAMKRVHALVDTNDGFKIAEEDLAIRGPGDILGTRQAGLPSLAFSDLVRHAPLIALTRDLAAHLVDEDPALARAENAGLRKLVHERYARRLALTAAG